MVVIKKLSRWVLYTVALILALATIAIAVVRFIIFPNINAYKERIAAEVTQVLGQKVTIGNIITGWDNFSPHFELKEVDLYDAENRPALHLNDVEASLSWLSIPLLQPRLSHLLVHKPDLTIRRTKDGSVFLAGINLANKGKPDFANWLISQSEVSVEKANLVWLDEMRQAPTLLLYNIDLNLENPTWRSLFGQHIFKLSANASTGTSKLLIASGNFVGRDVSQFKNWHGKLQLQVQDVDLTAWKPWLDYPVDLQSGSGKGKIWLDFSKSQFDNIKADVALSNLSVKFKQTNEPFVAKNFSGMLNMNQNSKNTTFDAKNIKLQASSGLNIDGGSGHIIQSIKNNKPWLNVGVNLNQFNLNSIKQLQNFIPLPQPLVDKITGFDPRGELSNIAIAWIGDPAKPSRYSIKSQFAAFGINANELIPGFENLTGSVDADEEGGEINLQSKNATLNFKDILRWPIPANLLNGSISWETNIQKSGELKPKILAKNIYISSPHITGTINASYDMNGVKGGYLDLTGSFDKGNAKYAPFYYPTILGNSTLHWLDTSILQGNADDVHLIVKGNLDDFPYVTAENKLDPKLGLFRVTAKISNAVLEYGTDWPLIEGLSLDMLFEGKRMELIANQGHIYSNKIIKSKTEIPQLDADDPILLIDSEIEGTVADGVKFVNSSPVKLVTLGFTDSLKTSGIGKLSLALKIPMQHLESSKYKGSYKIINGNIFANADVGLPEINKINGELNFTENSFSTHNVDSEILGGPAKLSLQAGADKIIHINASGHISDTGIKKVVSNVVTNALQGSTEWVGDITIKKPMMDVNFRSNMVGMAVQLPSPLGKSAQQQAMLNITNKQISANEDIADITYNNIVSAKILRSEKLGKLTFDRGDIGINVAATRPSEAGLSMHGKLDYVNADEWLALLNKPNEKTTTDSINISKADLSVEKLDIFDRKLNSLRIIAKPNETGLQMAIDSQEISGDAEWQSPKNTTDAGKIIARLKNLSIPANNESTVSTSKKDIRRLNSKYPALDITADNFQLGNKKLGALELNAYENNDDWVIQKLKIFNPDSALLADGTWHNWTRNPNTSMKFTFSVNNIGNALKRFDQADAVKGGEAEIVGQLQWPGSPHEFETTGLSGNFKLDARKGQVLKVQPGVGRLLGLLSLQSLPRRLSLDFRDLFSDGFAFDKISATARVDKGILRSDDFLMTGPAAEAKIKGEANIEKETQNLRIKVRPHISDSLSLAALAGGPIVGAAAFVAQKLLKDPFNKIVQSEYVITGTWDNPHELESPDDATKKPNNTPMSPNN
jgi:uncharacterized protein (TIGR02099 family)